MEIQSYLFKLVQAIRHEDHTIPTDVDSVAVSMLERSESFKHNLLQIEKDLHVLKNDPQVRLSDDNFHLYNNEKQIPAMNHHIEMVQEALASIKVPEHKVSTLKLVKSAHVHAQGMEVEQ